MDKPRRAFRLTLALEADTRSDLASALNSLAYEVDSDQLTVGCSGSPSSGAIYELLRDPDMTHEKYFEELRAYLEAAKASQSADVKAGG